MAEVSPFANHNRTLFLANPGGAGIMFSLSRILRHESRRADGTYFHRMHRHPTLDTRHADLPG